LRAPPQAVWAKERAVALATGRKIRICIYVYLSF
jgi:hypothetical protein